MTCRVRPLFYSDIADQELWLLDRANGEIADRWHEALWDTIGFLIQQPFIGRERRDLKMAGIRSWRIDGFERWLIFYQVQDDSIVLYRVVSGTMELEELQLD